MKRGTQLVGNRLSDFVVALSLVLYPILSYYVGPMSLNYGVWLFFLAIIILVISKRTIKLFSCPLGYLLFWAYCAINLLFLSPSIKPTYFVPGGIRFFIFSLIMCFTIKNLSIDIMLKIYRFFFIIFTIIFVFQEVVLFSTNTIIPFLLPISDKIDYGGGITNMELYLLQSMAERAPSLFIEPSYFAQFCMPLLALEFFSESKKDKLFTPWVIAILFVTLFIKSGCGYFGAALLSFIKLFNFYKKHSVGYRLLFVIVIIPILYVLLSQVISSEIGSDMMARFEELNVNNKSGSGFLRVFRGYIVYGGLPSINQLFGISMEDLSTLNLAGFSHTGDFAADTYFNGVQTVLISKGLVGFILLAQVYINLYKKNTILGKTVVWLFLLLSLMEATFLFSGMLICTVIIANEKLRNSNKIYGEI